MFNSDHPNFKIDPNDRIDNSKKRFGPLGPPKADKDFKDFLHVKEDPSLEQKGKQPSKGKFEDELLASNAQGAPVDQPGLSLFDLSAGKKGDKIDAVAAAGTPADIQASAAPTQPGLALGDGSMPDLQSENPAHQSSVFELATGAPGTTGAAGKRLAVDENGVLANPADPRAIIDKTKRLGSRSTEFVEEKPDLVSIAQSQKVVVPEQIMPSAQVEQSKPTGGPDYKTIQQIVDQIVDKIYLVKEDGRSDTTIVLKNPPLFDGVKITLSSYESARGQYNITFENLTQMAKNVLDFQANRDALRLALDNKGVVIQMFTTTTATNTVAVNFEQREQPRDQQGFGGGQGQQKQKDEEQS